MNKEIIKIETQLTVPEAISVLQQNSVTNYFRIRRESLVGVISNSKVSLYRGIPFQGNAFLPVLKGKFENIDGKVVLVATWTFHWYTKIFGSLFVLIALLVIFGQGFAWSQIVFFLFVLLVVFFTYKVGQKWAIDDKEWIVKKIQTLLNG